MRTNILKVYEPHRWHDIESYATDIVKLQAKLLKENGFLYTHKQTHICTFTHIHTYIYMHTYIYLSINLTYGRPKKRKVVT